MSFLSLCQEKGQYLRGCLTIDKCRLKTGTMDVFAVYVEDIAIGVNDSILFVAVMICLLVINIFCICKDLLIGYCFNMYAIYCDRFCI